MATPDITTWVRFKAKVEAAFLNTALEPIAHKAWWKTRGIMRPSFRGVAAGEEQIATAIARICRRDSNCMDVGCNKGHILKHIVNISPEGRHLAFEPVPELASFLRTRFTGKPVTVHEVALSDRSGESTFFCVEGDHGRSALKKQEYPRVNERVREQTVRVERLDDMLPAGSKVDFIKIDCEGNDLFVVRGASKTIETSRPVIIFERSRSLEQTFGVTGEMIFDEFAKYSMHLARLGDWLHEPMPLSRTEFVEGRGGNIVAWFEP